MIISLPFSVNANNSDKAVDAPVTQEKVGSSPGGGFVVVDLTDKYQLDVKPYRDPNHTSKDIDEKFLVFGVNIKKIELGYEFQNTEKTVKSIIP